MPQSLYIRLSCTKEVARVAFGRDSLWFGRIQEFRSSGQTCKNWCGEHQIPVSTMTYWIRKLNKLEFMNAMLSERLALAQRKQFGSSSEKYAEGYEQMNLFTAVRNAVP